MLNIIKISGKLSELPTAEACGLPAFKVGFTPTPPHLLVRGLTAPIELITPWAMFTYPPQPTQAS